jgi:proline iminopeptidase
MYVSVGDVRLFFDVEGGKLVPEGATLRERPTLVLLHGGPGFDHSLYRPEFSRLADVAQVIYLDHRGNGRSDHGDPARWTLAQWGDDLRVFCDALGIEQPIVFGNSFGGMVAMSYATRHPDHPAKLVLSSTSARQRLDRVLAAFEQRGGAEARDVARRYWENPNSETTRDYARVCLPLYTHATWSSDALARVVWSFDVMHAFGAGECRRFDLLPALSRVRCPTLVMAGEDDPITPIGDSEDIVAALPPGLTRFERFTGAGHGVYRDAPERAFSLLREFVCAPA